MIKQFLTMCLVIGGLCAGVAQAQDRGGDKTKSDALPLSSYLDERLTTLDRELSAAVIQRAQVPPAQVAMVDLEIDLRILQRWVWEQMSKTESADLQAALYARGLALEQAAAEVRSYLATRTGMTPNRTQAEALVKLHQLTYALEDLKDIAQLDAVAFRAGVALVNVVAENPVDPSSMPVMRPKPLPREPATGQTRPVAQRSKNDPPTLAELQQQAQIMAVSPPLRAQLVAAAKAAQEASMDPRLQEESSRLHKLLIEAMELAEGLAANTAVASEDRIALEGQLTSALALSADRRLRAAGEARMAALRPYRQTLSRIGRLRLTPEERARLNAALNYAQANPDSGDTIFSAIEQYREQRARLTTLPPEPSTDPAARRAIDEMRKQFDQATNDFYQTASNLGVPGLLATTPEALKTDIDRMKRSLDLIEMLYKLPAQVQSLAQHKPRPAGMLEKRMTQTMIGLATTNSNAQRDAHEAMLKSVATVAALADDLSKHPLASLPAAEAEPFTGGQAAAFDAAWKALVQELASTAAAGNEIEAAKVDRLRQFKRVVEGIRDGMEMGKGQTDWESLSRWADWTMRQTDFANFLTPMQQELSAAVAALASGEKHDFRDFERGRDRYAPIIAFVRRSGAHAEQLKTLPTGIAGTCAKLTTPMAGPEFMAERYAGLATRLWIYLDASMSQQVLRELARRVAPEVGMRVR